MEKIMTKDVIGKVAEILGVDMDARTGRKIWRMTVVLEAGKPVMLTCDEYATKRQCDGRQPTDAVCDSEMKRRDE